MEARDPQRSYSIAEMKNHLGRIVHEVEEGSPVEVTRRGRPVAVVVSLDDYRRLTAPKRNFWEICQDFRQRYDLEKLDIDPDEIFAVAKDPSPGRDFSW